MATGRKQLAINMVANLIAFGVQFGVSFVLTPYIISELGAKAYGFVPLANNFIGYTNIITVALNSMASRFISIEINRGNVERANRYFNSVLIANSILAAVLLVPLALVVVFANGFLDIPDGLLADVQGTFAFAFAGLELMLVLSVFGCVYFVRNRIDLSAKRNIEGNVLRAAVLIALFTFVQPHIWFVTGTTMLVNVYLCLMNVRYTRELLPELRLNPRDFSWGAVRTLLGSGVWNSVNQLSVVLLTSLDLLLMNMFVGAQASGEYSIVKMLPTLIGQIVAVMVEVFVPQFTIQYARGRMGELVESVEFSVKSLGAIVTVPIGFLIVFGGDFFRIWVPGQDASLLQALSILSLIPCIVTSSISTVYNVYTVTNKLRTPALVWVGLGFVNVAMVVCLLKFTDLGIWVIPIVSLVMGVGRNLTFTPVYAARCLGVHWSTFYRCIFRACIGVVASILISSLARAIVVPTGWPMLFCLAAVCGTLGLLVNLVISFKPAERREFIAIGLAKLKKGKGSSSNG